MNADGRGKSECRGKLISVGGGDRAEVNALAAQLVGWLHERGVSLVQFDLPTRGPVGSLIRLQAQSRLQLDPASLALLWTADRLDLLSREGGILAQLEAGTTVICMYYAWWEIGYRERSDTVTQSGFSPEADNPIDPVWLERINARCLRPDLSLCVEDRESFEIYRQQIAALLWPGEETV